MTRPRVLLHALQSTSDATSVRLARGGGSTGLPYAHDTPKTCVGNLAVPGAAVWWDSQTANDTVELVAGLRHSGQWADLRRLMPAQ